MAKALEMGMARLKGGEKEETRNLFRRWGREPKTKVVFQRVDVQEGRRLWVGLWLYRYLRRTGQLRSLGVLFPACEL